MDWRVRAAREENGMVVETTCATTAHPPSTMLADLVEDGANFGSPPVSGGETRARARTTGCGWQQGPRARECREEKRPQEGGWQWVPAVSAAVENGLRGCKLVWAKTRFLDYALFYFLSVFLFIFHFPFSHFKFNLQSNFRFKQCDKFYLSLKCTVW
jgi:hypothetical protein